MSLHHFFYLIKPVVPRRVQILGRRLIARIKRRIHHGKWPIHPVSASIPRGWQGWPERRNFALVLSHDVDTAKGQDNCRSLMSIEEKLGFRSSFNFVPEGYKVSPALRRDLVAAGFAVGVHGLVHDGKLFRSRKIFDQRAQRIGHYLKEWGASGFHSPSMLSNLDWIADLDIEYDSSTFDTDPFEPQPDGVETIFPFWAPSSGKTRRYIELPYTLPQDHCLFIILKEKDIRIWEAKLDWIAANGGMAFLNTHPDYMNFGGSRCALEEYPVNLYISFLEYVKAKHAGQYWHALPGQIAAYYRTAMSDSGAPRKKNRKVSMPDRGVKRIWIDLDNTPHVPFFIPIKKELEKRGYQVVLSARDAFQVCELATRSGLVFTKVGHHFGKHMVLKLYGWISRGVALLPFVVKNKPDIALSHGSRSQVLTAKLLRIPTVVIMDYEHSKVPPFTRPDWEIVPDVISAHKFPGKTILKYHGLKEDVYIPAFRPDPRILDELGLKRDDFLITVRPPATEAHYHNPESERLFTDLMDWILAASDAKIVLLPRNLKQEIEIREQKALWFASGRVIVPKRAVSGLNLLFFSDLVISGGGTMNREAASLGVPVYSIFRGPLGDVDRSLAAEGRLVMISDPDEISKKIIMARRKKTSLYESGDRPALHQIVDHIETILKDSCAK